MSSGTNQPLIPEVTDQQKSVQALDFCAYHGWALPAFTGIESQKYRPRPLRSVGGRQVPGPRAYLDTYGGVHPTADSPGLEIWWRVQHGPVRRCATLGPTIRIFRLPLSQGLVTRWESDSLGFESVTTVELLQGVRMLWHHIRVRNHSAMGCQLQLIAALRPFSLERAGIIPQLSYHTQGLFLVQDQAVLYDAGATLDGIRLSNASTGDTLQLLEGTLPPEGGLSVRDLREKSLRIHCPLGLATGAATTVTDLEPGADHERWWAMPLEPTKAESMPWSLLTEAWSRNLYHQLAVELQTSQEAPNSELSPTRTQASQYVRTRLQDLTTASIPAPLDSSVIEGADLPLLVEAASTLDLGEAAWSLLSRFLHRQDTSGLIQIPGSDPVLTTAGWMSATLSHLERHPVLTGIRSPFPSEDPWPRALRMAVLGLGLEFRRRSREGWQAARTSWFPQSGQDHASLAYTLQAIRQFAMLREVAISTEESVAMLRVHSEIRQLLHHSVAQSLEHSSDGWLPPAAGLPVSSLSVRTLESFLRLEQEESPVQLGLLRATARELFRLAAREPHGLLRNPWGSLLPVETLRLSRILHLLGYQEESLRVRARVYSLAVALGQEEWWSPFVNPTDPEVSGVSCESLAASALAVLIPESA